MADRSAIEWTDATVNFWWGCTKVGPACDHCYAETWDKRIGGAHWGIGVPRRKIESAPKLLAKLNEQAAKTGTRKRVFIQSMSDLFDLEVTIDWFSRAWTMIEVCRRLEIQIVTKRVSAIEKRLAEIGRTSWPDHAGLIITVANQAEADRDIPRLLALKQKFRMPWVGLSCEPLLGAIDLHAVIPDPLSWSFAHGFNGLDWVIVGGESGPNARPFWPSWARSLRDQCVGTGTAFFFKQFGEFEYETRPGTEVVLPDLRQGERAMWGDGKTNHVIARRVGKKAAGRLLDGREWNEFPNMAKATEAA
jgi:protein gp37